MTFRVESLDLEWRYRLDRIRVLQTSTYGETDKSRCRNYLVKCVIDLDGPRIFIPIYRDNVCKANRV